MSSNAGYGKIPDMRADGPSLQVLPLCKCMTLSRALPDGARQFSTASDSGFETGNERSSSESMKL